VKFCRSDSISDGLRRIEPCELAGFALSAGVKASVGCSAELRFRVAMSESKIARYFRVQLSLGADLFARQIGSQPHPATTYIDAPLRFVGIK